MPRSRLWLILIPIALILVAALALIFLPASLQSPRVLQIEPANNATEILPISPITITFSAPMNRDATQAAIQFSPRLDGQFAWRDEQTLTFTPRAQLPISTTLTLNISQDARSWLQRPLQNEMVSRFTTLARPFVVNSNPAPDAQFIYNPDRVMLTFNRAMDRNTLAESLQIEPPLQNFSVQVEERTMTLYAFFEPRTRYQITLLPFARDAKYGIELEREYVWSFTTASQYPHFSILNRERVLKFSANEPLNIPTQFTNVSRLDAALYAITQKEFDEQTIALFETWYAFQPASAPIKTRSVTTNAQLDQYAQQTLKLDALARGTYYLNITTPEGVSDAQLIVVE